MFHKPSIGEVQVSIAGVGAFNWSYDTLQLSQNSAKAKAQQGFTLEADTVALSRGASSSSESAATADYSKLPADLVRVLNQGGSDLPSAGDIELMAGQEQSFKLEDGHGNGIAAWDNLTAGDKQLIKNVTGFDMFADPFGKTLSSPDVQSFIGRLNMDRYSDSHYGNSSGLNGGEINEAYINKLIQENFSARPGQAVVPLPILYNVQAYLASQSNETAQPQTQGA